MKLLKDRLEETNVWETKEQTKVVLDNCTKEGLLLYAKSISLVDYHRLPQRPIFRNQQKINRPIISKLSTVFDKQEVMKAAKNLKNYRPYISDFDSSGSSEKYALPIIYPYLLIYRRKH